MSSPPESRQPRRIAGRYRIDHVLGSGAMGTVWSAWDEMVHRKVAIKEINFPPGMPAHEVRVLVDRTLREARAIGALSHPHVITLFDIVLIDGQPAIVMEMLDSQPLSTVIRERGRLEPHQAAVVGAAVASALTEAHRAGITHRDVKPGNVLVATDGRVKLTDFGIARAVTDDTMTSTGLLLGSPAYISPEVAGGAQATPLSDAWGLGGLLFACVEGRPPFDKGEPIATLTSVVADPVPPAPHAGALRDVIGALLEKDPGRRLPVEQVRQELVRLAGGAELTLAARRRTLSDVDQIRAVAPRSQTELPPPPWASQPSAVSLQPLPALRISPSRPRWALPVAILLAVLLAVGAYFGVQLLWDLGATR